jgi:hypothetical protein
MEARFLPVFGPRVAINAVVMPPRAVKQKIVAIACGRVKLKTGCARAPIGIVVSTNNSKCNQYNGLKTSEHAGHRVENVATLSNLPYQC